jgi:hypothetical protein
VEDRRTIQVCLASAGNEEGNRRLKATVLRTPFPHYEQGPSPCLLVRFEADGARSVARFVARKWQSCDDTSAPSGSRANAGLEAKG